MGSFPSITAHLYLSHWICVKETSIILTVETAVLPEFDIFISVPYSFEEEKRKSVLFIFQLISVLISWNFLMNVEKMLLHLCWQLVGVKRCPVKPAHVFTGTSGEITTRHSFHWVIVCGYFDKRLNQFKYYVKPRHACECYMRGV